MGGQRYWSESRLRALVVLSQGPARETNQTHQRRRRVHKATARWLLEHGYAEISREHVERVVVITHAGQEALRREVRRQSELAARP